MKILSGLVLISALAFSLNNTSEESSLHKNYLDGYVSEQGTGSEIQEIYPHYTDEGNEKEAKELEKKVLEDMKNNPEKVWFAEPVKLRDQ